MSWRIVPERDRTFTVLQLEAGRPVQAWPGFWHPSAAIDWIRTLRAGMLCP